MAIKKFEKIHKKGMDMLFDTIHKKRKVVIGTSSNGNEYIVECIISRNRKTQESYKDNTQDMDKYLIKFRMSDIIKAVPLKTTSNVPIQINLIDYIKYSGIKYNIYRDTINNQTQDLVILEITNFKG